MTGDKPIADGWNDCENTTGDRQRHWFVSGWAACGMPIRTAGEFIADANQYSRRDNHRRCPQCEKLHRDSWLKKRE